MPVNVRIPAPLQDLTDGQSQVQCEGSTVSDVLTHLDVGYPGLKDRICDETGTIRRFVSIYVNEDDVRFLQSEATPVKDGDEISIIPALAGG